MVFLVLLTLGTTINIVFSVNYYLEIFNVIFIYYISHFLCEQSQIDGSVFIKHAWNINLFTW